MILSHSRFQNFLLLISSVFLTFGACDSSSSTVAQTTDASANREAARLLAAAGDGLNNGDRKQTLENCQKVIGLLPDDLRVQQRAAELLYLSGYAKESLPAFDRVIELDPSKAAQNWQRGIALATAGEFKRGAEQFKLHHDVNPDDVENSAWYFLCVAKSEGVEAAKKAVIGSRGDSRPPMMEILKMLKGEATPDQVLEAAAKSGRNEFETNNAKSFGDLYVGLYFDSMGKSEEARKYLKRSLDYDVVSYMSRTAKVYLETRFKNSEDTDSNVKP